MKIKKDIIKYMICAIMFIVIILVPLLVMKNYDYILIGKSTNLMTINFSMDEKVSDIPLIKRIHEIYNSLYSCSLSENILISVDDFTKQTDNELHEDIKKQLSILYNKGIIPYKDYRIECITSSDITKNKVLTVAIFCENLKQINISYDELTHKIISLTYGNSKGIKLTNTEREKYEHEFLSYLGLASLDNWTYTGTKYVLSSAHLYVQCKTLEEDSSILLEVGVEGLDISK